MSEPIENYEKPKPIMVGKKVFGPCGSCAFWVKAGKSTHFTGRCHGAPPVPAGGFAMVHGDMPGCAQFAQRTANE